MKRLFFYLICLCLCSFVELHAADSTPPASPSNEKADADAKATTINSEKFQLDLAKGRGIFVGKVQAVDPHFTLHADEMTVFFSKDNKPERFVAKGQVTIENGNRTTTSQQAEYILSEKKLTLTGDPVVMQNQNRVTGSVIIIYPDSDRMDVQGRTAVRLFAE